MFKIAKKHWLLLGFHMLATVYTANVYPFGEKTTEAGTQTQWQSSKDCKIDKDSLNLTSPPCIFSTFSSNPNGTAKQKKVAAKKEVELFLGRIEYSEKENKMLCVYEKNKSSSFIWLHTLIDEKGTEGMESLEFDANKDTEDQKDSLYNFFNNFTCADVDSINRDNNCEDGHSDDSRNNDKDEICSQDAFLMSSLDLPKKTGSPTELIKKSPIQVHYHYEKIKCATRQSEGNDSDKDDNSDSDGDSDSGSDSGSDCGSDCGSDGDSLAGAYKIELQVTFNRKKTGTTPASANQTRTSKAKATGATLYVTSPEYCFLAGPTNTKGLAVNRNCKGNIVLDYPSDQNIMNDRSKLYTLMLTNGKSVVSYDEKGFAIGSHFIKATEDKIKIKTESGTINHFTPHSQSLFFCNENEPTALINIPENNQLDARKGTLSKTSSLLQSNELPALIKPKKRQLTNPMTTSITTTKTNPAINLQRKGLPRHSKLNCPWSCSIL